MNDIGVVVAERCVEKPPIDDFDFDSGLILLVCRSSVVMVGKLPYSLFLEMTQNFNNL